MDGDIAPLPALLRLAEAHDAWLVVDDAHGFGVLGERGRGVLEHFGLCSERLILVGTLGKAAGQHARQIEHPQARERKRSVHVFREDTASPARLPATPSRADSASTSASRWRGVAPST